MLLSIKDAILKEYTKVSSKVKDTIKLASKVFKANYKRKITLHCLMYTLLLPLTVYSNFIQSSLCRVYKFITTLIISINLPRVYYNFQIIGYFESY